MPKLDLTPWDFSTKMSLVDQVLLIDRIQLAAEKLERVKQFLATSTNPENNSLMKSYVDKLTAESYYIYTGIIIARIIQNQTLEPFRSMHRGNS